LIKPIEFCVPATKQNVQPTPSTPDLVGQPLRQDYVCYQAKCPTGAVPPAKRVADQFGVRVEQKYRPEKVCVPAVKLPVRCGDTGGPTCGGVCPTGASCKQAPGSSQCSCQPLPCGGPPDKGGTCGGACPEGQVCQVSNSTAGKPTCGCGQLPPPPCGTNPLTGSCGGTCTDPTLTCLPDATGNCSCLPVPTTLCSQAAGGTCGGTCPNPEDSCVPSNLPGQPCTCVPAPCHQDTVTGVCTGTCAAAPGGGTCHLDGANGCVCGPPPCTIDPASLQCGGTCPGGGTCAPDAANNCGCLNPCGFDAQHTVCGGSCPPGQACEVIGQECVCNPVPPCSFGAEVPALCSGSCPPGKVCKTQATSKTTLSCLCLNN
jgi:hypothetical protein